MSKANIHVMLTENFELVVEKSFSTSRSVWTIVILNLSWKKVFQRVGLSEQLSTHNLCKWVSSQRAESTENSNVSIQAAQRFRTAFNLPQFLRVSRPRMPYTYSYQHIIPVWSTTSFDVWDDNMMMTFLIGNTSQSDPQTSSPLEQLHLEHTRARYNSICIYTITL